MPVEQLVYYFNDHFEREHQSSFRPFILENGSVSGVFGPIRISSTFSPLRQVDDYEILRGHIAQLSVSTYETDVHNNQPEKIGNLLTDAITQPADFQSIINLDRLCRTVHMLNYLTYAHNGGVLILDVDPRHILGVEQNHGAYFEEIIIKCGLAPRNIVISATINNFYAQYHTQLLSGLNNYRDRGYQIALNIGSLYTAKGLRELIDKLSPNYLRITSPSPEMIQHSTSIWLSSLKGLIELQHLIGGQTILQHVNKKEQANIALTSGFGLVQGDYYERLITDHLRCL
ncbi:EAL domain-containing protein [Nitrosomonas sp. JL21]|uniref:hypothetical protein n=1 Tax=Nitrosomonas sp. JL21 TaxID=153949 RepID=UPI00136A0DA5|nr:hypothetical protein [Nitrosomonas sp. JL21]MBL8497837.1 hypothetical protein [Nitrosomonas sp.]MXS76784.1 EAL domain-containing protein [Nitrosomonas sp. JL21]